ncbi:MAG TPA: thioredoxin [Cyclobacteriaceae bacterium]|nr:thioredoxin [Cyclobacteriaceae bacterium]
METFQQLIQSQTPLLVDFHAEWCGPCKMMGPIIKEIAQEVDGKARVIKVDIDKNPDAASRYDVRAVPTLIIFKSGKPVWKHTGMIDKHSLVKQILNFA